MSALAFMSSDRKTGCSSVARCFAESFLKDDPQRKVMLLCCCGDGIDVPGAEERLSFSDVASYIRKGIVDYDEICERSREKNGLCCIYPPAPGFEDLPPQAMTEFVSELSKRFSLVICDIGSSLLLGLSLGAARACSVVIGVVTSGEACLRRYEWFLPLYERLGIFFDGFILNGVSGDCYYTPAEVRKRLGASKDNFYTVRRSAFSRSAEAEGKSLLCYRDRGFARDISGIVTGICGGFQRKVT